ncbi:MAG: efflux RND transporter periplasmic adaptor subunit [Kofleriaceae bacterium]
MPAAESSRRGGGIVSWVITVLLLGVLVGYLALVSPPSPRRRAAAAALPAVRVSGPRELEIASSSALEAQLAIASVSRTRATSPLLEVTGAIAASRPAGAPGHDARWTFASSDLLAAYAEWRKAAAEVAFARTERQTTRQLNAARLAAQERVVERMVRLVQAGSESARELASEQAALQQTRLESAKLAHAAEAAVLAAERSRAALDRQLAQAGIDPEVLGAVRGGSALLVAEVPEARIERVAEGQQVTARFYGLSGAPRAGKIDRLAPTVTADQRILRALIVLDDPRGELRPGMFAEVGRGAEPRDAVVAPLDGVLHIGRADYLLAERGAGRWQVVEVALGDALDDHVEVLRGLAPGDRVIGTGAILLKPFVVEALARAR